jgi:hypothetical protein
MIRKGRGTSASGTSTFPSSAMFIIDVMSSLGEGCVQIVYKDRSTGFPHGSQTDVALDV